MELKNFLKTSREKASLSQHEAAKAIGVSVTTIQNWEYGNSIPDEFNIKKISKVYYIRPSEIMSIRGVELDSECSVRQDENISDTNKDEFEKIVHLLPDDYSYKMFEDLFLTKTEEEVLIALKLASDLNSDQFSVLKTLKVTHFETLNILNTLLDRGFIQKGEYYFLTTKGKRSLLRIKVSDGNVVQQRTDNTLFSLKEFVSDKGDEELSRIRKLIEYIGEDGKALSKYVKDEKRYLYNRNSYREVAIAIGEHNLLDIKGSQIRYLEDLPKSLPSKYFLIEDVECQLEDYIKERKVYLETMGLYNKHGSEVIKKPDEVEMLTVQKIVLSDIGKEFLKAMQ